MTTRRRDRLLGQISRGVDPQEAGELLTASPGGPLDAALFPEGERRAVLERRLAAWPGLLRDLEGHPPAALARFPPSVLWSYPFPLAQLIHRHPGKVFGFAGPPGVGKTTLIAWVARCLRALDGRARVVAVSLDDFYLSRAERRARGLAWRAQPGSHDLAAAVAFLGAARAGERVLRVPRFDHGADEPGAPEVVPGPASAVLMEGWLLGLDGEGYGAVAKELDHLTYIGCPLALARRRRLAREEALRAAGRGFSEAEMGRFWRQVLAPGVRRWVEPIRARADLVVDLDGRGAVRSAVARS